MPRYSSIAWGVCVPASCSYQNVETEIQDRLETTLQGTCLEAQVRVEPAMCQKRNEPIPWSTWIVGLDTFSFSQLYSEIGLINQLEYHYREKLLKTNV